MESKLTWQQLKAAHDELAGILAEEDAVYFGKMAEILNASQPAPSVASPYKGPINQPCSACSAGDTAMEYHDHEHVKPEFRGAPVASAGEPAARFSLQDALDILNYATEGRNHDTVKPDLLANEMNRRLYRVLAARAGESAGLITLNDLWHLLFPEGTHIEFNPPDVSRWIEAYTEEIEKYTERRLASARATAAPASTAARNTLHAGILAALMTSLIEQDCPDSVSAYKVMDEIIKYLDVALTAAPASTAAGEHGQVEGYNFGQLRHMMNCPALTPGNEEDCTCQLKWRIRWQTEQEMHNAWRKRAEEAEAVIAAAPDVKELRKQLRVAIYDALWRSHRAALTLALDAFDKVPKPPPAAPPRGVRETLTEMYLCEINRLVLHSNQTYIFRSHPGCYECSKYLGLGLASTSAAQPTDKEAKG